MDHSKRAALRAIDQAQIQLNDAYTILGFYPYPDSIGLRVAAGLDRRVMVEGNHGRESMGSFPTERGKRFDDLRQRISELRRDLEKMYDEIIEVSNPTPTLE